jgi:ATP synthase protein I
MAAASEHDRFTDSYVARMAKPSWDRTYTAVPVGVIRLGKGRPLPRCGRRPGANVGHLAESLNFTMDVKPRVYRIVKAQLAVTVMISIAVLVVAGVVSAYSALTGGMISVIANGYFARHVFGRDYKSPRQMVSAFYVGEVIKIGITIVLFAFAVIVMDVLFLPLFITYAVTLMVYWFALLPALSDIDERM